MSNFTLDLHPAYSSCWAMFGIELHLSFCMVRAILWTNLEDAMGENGFLFEKVRDSSHKQWSRNVIVLRSSGLDCRIIYSPPSSDKIKGLSNWHNTALCRSWDNVDSYMLSVALPGEGNELFVHCQALRRSVINDQAWTVCNESGNGDMGMCTRQSSVTSGHPLSAPPLCIIVPNSQLHSISTFHWSCSC